MSFRVKTGHKTGEAAFSNRFAKNVDRLPSRLRGLALMFLLIGLAPLTAYAACTSPAGVAGEMGYNLTGSGDYEYCNGTSWVSMETGDMSGGGGGGSCPENYVNLPTNTIATDGLILDHPNPADRDWMGRSIATNGTIVVVGTPYCTCSLKGQNDREGSAYVFNATDGSLISTLTNPDPTHYDEFGWSVAVSGTTAYVGAWKDDPGGLTDAGAVYIFDTTTGNLTGTLNHPSPASSDFFGSSIAIDGNNAVIGAQSDGAAGTAYVFDLTTGNVTATLNSPDSQGAFGSSVALSGNIALVGAEQYTTGGATWSGRAYLYDISDGSLIATLANPEATPSSYAYFGQGVAVSGSTAIVGAPGQGGGRLYFYDTSDGSLIATLDDPSPYSSGDYGQSIAISGGLVAVGSPGVNTTYLLDLTTRNLMDAINDGSQFGYSVAISGTTLAVGQPGYSPGDTYVGRAYIYNLFSGDGLKKVLNSPTPSANSGFGKSVAASYDLMVVGANAADPGGNANAGEAYVYDTSGSLVATLVNPLPTLDDQFGISVAISGAYAVVGSFHEDPSSVSDAGAAYVYSATSGTLITTLNNPAPATWDYFGESVSIWNTTAVVGARNADPGAVNSAGVAYVFNATNGTLITTLNNPAPATSDQFGNSVAIFGERAVVGASFDDPGGVSNAGTAYVFDTTDGSLIATLNNPNPDTDDQFGHSVAISGDTAVVSARLDDPGGVSGAGIAYVFDINTGTLVATLNNPDPTANDSFGNSVAVYGSVVIVGTSGDDPGSVSGAGTTYVFDKWSGTHLATLNNPEPDSSDQFGGSVAISGSTVIVAAVNDDAGGLTSAGTSYVFDLDLNSILPNPDLDTYDEFARSVSIDGTTAVIGAYGDGTGGTAYAIDTSTGDLISTLNNPAPANGDSFGMSVAVSGTTAVVGAYLDDPGGVSNAGTAYVFDTTDGSLIATLNNPAPTADDEFGLSVAVSGTTAVVGAWKDDPGGVSGAGTAYVFDTATGNLVTTLNNPDPTALDYFGKSVAISGTTAIVGASGDDPGGVSGAGTAYVFDTTTGSLTNTLNSTTPVASDNFGQVVAIDGTTAVIGATGVDVSGQNSTGRAYVFNTTTGNLTTTLNLPTPETTAQFGFGVAVSGTTALVSAYGTSPFGTWRTGTAFAFDTTTGALLKTIHNYDPQTDDYFAAVAISGTTAVIGAFWDDYNRLDRVGTAYVYCVGNSGGGSSSCSTAGEMQYDSTNHVITWCDGTTLKAAGTAGSGGAGCSTPASSEGAMLYNTGVSKMQFCDGASWVDIP